MGDQWDWLFEAQYQSTDESQNEDQPEDSRANTSAHVISDDEGDATTSSIPKSKRNNKPWVKRRPDYRNPQVRESTSKTPRWPLLTVL